MADPINLSSPLPDISPYDLCLGRYLRVFEQLEHVQFSLIRWLLEIKIPIANILVASPSVGQHGLRELILAVAAIRMNENDFRQFQNFCDSMKKAATTRNHIVHGKWQVKIKTHINDTGEKIFTPTEWQRFYAPVDQTQYQNIFGPGDNQKAKATSCYSANRIDQLGNDIRELSLKITNWCKSIQLADLTDPVPLELSQPYTRKD